MLISVQQGVEEESSSGADPVDQMNRDNNPYILYPVEVVEKGMLAETPREAAKIIKYLAGAFFIAIAAVLVTFRRGLINRVTFYPRASKEINPSI